MLSCTARRLARERGLRSAGNVVTACRGRSLVQQCNAFVKCTARGQYIGLTAAARQQSTATAPSDAMPSSTAPLLTPPVAAASGMVVAPVPVASSTVGLFGQKFEIEPVQAWLRDKKGSSNAQWARRNGYIPGNVYGFDASGSCVVKLVYCKQVDLRRIINRRGDRFTNTLVDLTIDGVTERVLPRDVRLHPFLPKITCVNWLRYRVGAYPGARVDIPIRPINEEKCPAVREGGWLLQIFYKLPVYAAGEEIPDTIPMDLRGKRIGDKVWASELELNEGLTLRSKERDFAIAKLIAGSRRDGVAEEAGEGEAGKEAEGAAKPKPGPPGAKGPAATPAKPAEASKAAAAAKPRKVEKR